MAVNNGQRVAAFLLALLFFASTVGAAAYVVWELNREDEVQEITQQSIEEQLDQQTEQEEPMLAGTILENFDTREQVPELEIIDLTVGSGETVAEGADVVAHYTGAFASDGLIFQSSKDSGQPVPFNLNGVISGWTEGVPGMKVGGVRRLIIPAEKAYGVAPEGYVYDPNDRTARPLGPLVFDIELVSLGN